MANNFSLCLIAAMDRLWFQQNILFPENQLEPKQSSVADQQEPAPEEQVKKRSRKRNHSRSHSSSSSSPPAQKRDKRMNNQCKLRKSTSFRSLKDLELEVKGFVDLYSRKNT
ncbi:uncharacterized protein LOC120211609 [Hibiscus syriacus]|uniref:uncharacterized protein LOC120211609 n=1 Tax=Hibiscus syriacus TaxID=106335 RepID=UPI00192070E8|nr:uncharacterized protein LOC120211609 [Hibiscus syriacus]